MSNTTRNKLSAECSDISDANRHEESFADAPIGREIISDAFGQVGASAAIIAGMTSATEMDARDKKKN